MFFFFFNDTATTEIYTLSLHDALPIYLDLNHPRSIQVADFNANGRPDILVAERGGAGRLIVYQDIRSEEHTSELQSQSNLVCRLLLEKKKKKSSGTPETTYVHRTETDT